MRKHLFGTALCTTFLAFGALAQTHTGGTTDSGSSSDTPTSDSSKPSTWDRIKSLSATGRSGHQDVSASKLNSAEVKSSQGETIGTINDLIINPRSGKVDFAVISLNGSTTSGSSQAGGQTGGYSSGRTGTTSPSSAAGTSTAGGSKQVAVPWSLLRSASTGSSTTASGMAQQTFTFTGDANKLQTAPAFDPNTDMSQPGWLQSVFSYFGVSQNYGTGGATSPGGTSSGAEPGSGRSYPNGNPSNNP